MKTGRHIIFSVTLAALLWFFMFSPWTAALTDFWLSMSVSAVILLLITITFTPDRKELFKLCDPFRKDSACHNSSDRLRAASLQLLAGVLIAFFLWGVFWLGDKISSLLFDFARPQVDSVYSMKNGFSPWVIALLLLLVIGPAEELFWRGFVQRSLSKELARASHRGTEAPTAAFILTTLTYALVHIWSFNFMLVMAALVAGVVWGLLYRLRPELLPALVLSHSLWDALVFVIFPI